jgi:hypothetical protein
MNLGSVVIGGRRFPIRELRLGASPADGRGSVICVFDIAGPLPAFAGPLTVFGADETGIVQGHEVRMPQVPAGITVRFIWALTVATVEGDGIPFAPVLPWTA